MRQWAVVLGACLALTVGDAYAQRGLRVSGPEGIAISLPPGHPDDTKASVLEEIIAQLASFDNSGVRVNDGVVRPGGEIATRNVPYQHVSRVRREVSRAGALGGEQMLLPAGTPVFATEYVNETAVQFNGSAAVRYLYCGASGASGYCVLGIGDDWRVAEVRGVDPYVPLQLGPFVPTNEPELELDPSAAAELPPRTEVYRLESVRGSRATVSRFMRVGDREFPVGEVRVQKLLLGSILVEWQRAEDGGLQVRSAPLNPENYEEELDDLAQFVLRNRQVRAR